jgi:hypothetical protein
MADPMLCENQRKVKQQHFPRAPLRQGQRAHSSAMIGPEQNLRPAVFRPAGFDQQASVLPLVHAGANEQHLPTARSCSSSLEDARCRLNGYAIVDSPDSPQD